MSGAGLAAQGILMWCWVERGVAVRREEEATPLDIGEEAPLEVDAEATLEMEGGWERMWGVLQVGSLLPVLEEVAKLADGFKLFIYSGGVGFL